MPRIPAAERPRLTLEDYIVFFTTRGGTGLSLHQLNEVPTLSLSRRRSARVRGFVRVL
jgi:hypothetical protein